MNDVRVLKGRCECGAVRYAVSDDFRYAMNCHCSRCRAGTGTAFKAFAGIEREKVAVVAGTERLLVFGSDDLNNTRCGVCGSLLFSVVRDGAYVHVALGSRERGRPCAMQPCEAFRDVTPPFPLGLHVCSSSVLPASIRLVFRRA